MKEFREWWENHRASMGPHTCQSSRGENLAQLADEEIWRAALEWVKREAISLDERGDISRGIINKELGDT